MAKKDDRSGRRDLTEQRNIAQNNLTNMREDMLIPQAQQAQNNWTKATEGDFQTNQNILNKFEEFSNTGGYSPQDIANMRSRGVAPIRGIYANANREVDRSKALQGGYSPGYGVLKGRMAREQSSALSDATIGVESNLAQMKQQGRLAGIAGMSQQYGTTPGMTATHGTQANNATTNWLQGQKLQNDIFGTTMNGYNQTRGGGYNYNWVGDAVKGAGTAIASDRNLKENIKPLNDNDILKGMKNIPISSWNYKGEDKSHIGPMAQDFKKYFGKGDGKTIDLVDVMGVTLAATKAMANEKKGKR